MPPRFKLKMIRDFMEYDCSFYFLSLKYPVYPACQGVLNPGLSCK
jgi:hypothetical protein